MQFPGEGHDYRDQTIAKGVYTIRYGLQPVNGDHLGVSPFRDYALLLPAAKDKTVASLPRKQLEDQSAESAGTSHPAVFFMLDVPGRRPRPAVDGPRRREEHLEGGRPPQPRGQGRVEAGDVIRSRSSWSGAVRGSD